VYWLELQKRDLKRVEVEAFFSLGFFYNYFYFNGLEFLTHLLPERVKGAKPTAPRVCKRVGELK